MLLGNSGNNAKVDLATVQATVATKYSWVIKSANDLVVPGENANMQFDSEIAYDIWNRSMSSDSYKVMYFSVDGKGTLEFSAWSDVDAEVFVYDQDRNVFDKFEIKANSFNERILNVSGITKVGFGANSPNGYGTLKILDPVIYNK